MKTPPSYLFNDTFKDKNKAQNHKIIQARYSDHQNEDLLEVSNKVRVKGLA